MSREIKFEYGFESVNGIIKKVYHLHEIPNIKEKCDVWGVLPLVYKRQFTGLKDSSDIDICDGDELSYTIFDYNDNDKQYTGVVKWFGSGFVVTQVPDDQGNGEYGIDLFWIHSQDEELKVVGNIHKKN